MFITVKQTAEFLGLEPHRVYYLLFMGYIEAVKIGDLWRVFSESAREYKEKRSA